jgi:imidazolonepropionase-like amidohydrolase
MKTTFLFISIFGFAALFNSASAQTAKPKRILIENPTVHIGDGNIFEKGLVGIEGDKIILVKNALAYTYDKSEWDTIIDLNGQHLYAGFVAPNSTLGLTEIDAVRATRDFNETGEINSNVRAQIAFNCESQIIETVRINGVLFTQATPRGGIISGTSAVMSNSCWNWEDGTISANDGIHLNWPESLQGGGWWAEPQPKTRNEKYTEEKRNIYDYFELALAYTKAENQTDLRYQALKDCFQGEKRVYIHANELQQLHDALDFIEHFELKHAVIVGGYDSYMMLDKLKLRNVPVMLPRLHELPENEDNPVDLVYRLPSMLQDAGVLFCLQNEGDMEAMNARNIPFLAGTAMAYGLTEEQAIQSVTINACKILGIDQYYGTIQVGKKASLFVSQGSALEMKSNNVTLILVDGKFVPVTSFQNDLYEKYKEKYGF